MTGVAGKLYLGACIDARIPALVVVSRVRSHSVQLSVGLIDLDLATSAQHVQLSPDPSAIGHATSCSSWDDSS
jgi:hypothetical protein